MRTGWDEASIAVGRSASPRVTRSIVARVVRLRTTEEVRRPPVEVAEEAHRGGYDENAHQRRVDRHRQGEGEPHRLDQDDAGQAEGAEHRDHDYGSARHQASGPLQAL